MITPALAAPRELGPDEHLWCPRWYPRTPDELPCNHFMEWGRYLTYVGADGNQVEFPTNDPDLFACTEHDCEQIEQISRAEWDRRVASARRLGAKRGWKQPTPEQPDIAGADADRIVRHVDAPCRARLPYGRNECQVVLAEVDTPAGPRHKLMCLSLTGAGYSADPDRRAADRRSSSHTNDPLPHWPPNF